VDGRGIPGNREEGARLLQKAAEMGDAGAMNELSLMYLDGLGVGKDAGKALEWCRTAALAGHPLAAYRLAFTYYRGDGVPPDHVRALAWLIVSEERIAVDCDAAERRHELAGLADQIAETLTDAELDAAQGIAREVLTAGN